MVLKLKQKKKKKEAEFLDASFRAKAGSLQQGDGDGHSQSRISWQQQYLKGKKRKSANVMSGFSYQSQVSFPNREGLHQSPKTEASPPPPPHRGAGVFFIQSIRYLKTSILLLCHALYYYALVFLKGHVTFNEVG